MRSAKPGPRLRRGSHANDCQVTDRRPGSSMPLELVPLNTLDILCFFASELPHELRDGYDGIEMASTGVPVSVDPLSSLPDCPSLPQYSLDANQTLSPTSG